MKKSAFIIVISVFLAFPVVGISQRLSLSDFIVHSDNPRYRYMGKGISELIAVEVNQSPDITLIERDKRVELLEEMEVSLSDLADPKTQITVGKLLTADFLIFGEIVDMNGKFLISLRMVKVETGEIVWGQQVSEKLTNYEYISGYFAESILTYLDVEIAETTLLKKTHKKEKDEKAMIAFSKALNHFDREETKDAREALSIAKKIDPESEAIKLYVNKLPFRMGIAGLGGGFTQQSWEISGIDKKLGLTYITLNIKVLTGVKNLGFLIDTNISFPVFATEDGQSKDLVNYEVTILYDGIFGLGYLANISEKIKIIAGGGLFYGVTLLLDAQGIEDAYAGYASLGIGASGSALFFFTKNVFLNAGINGHYGFVNLMALQSESVFKSGFDVKGNVCIGIYFFK